jgi:hypothetical protein
MAIWNITALNAEKISLLASNSVAALTSVPVPATAWLFASGLVSLLGIAKKKAW